MLGDPMTDLTVNGEIDYFRLARDRYFVPFSIKIPGSEIALAKSKGSAQTELEFIAQLRDEHTKAGGRGARWRQDQIGRSDGGGAFVASDLVTIPGSACLPGLTT